MSELPPPDLLDHGGRLRRLVLALIVGGAVAAATYLICTSLAEPDDKSLYGGSAARAWKFVFYMTAFFGAGAFAITLAIANWLAKRKDERERVPRAEVR
jgi:hypothetical protein